MPHRRTALVLLAMAATLAVPSVLAAQEPRSDSLPILGRCDGRVVSEVLVRAEEPPLGRVFRRSRTLVNIVRATHVTTRDDIIRRAIVLGAGDRCSELRRAESERLLRAQPYLADARVVTRDDGRGGVRLEVTTWDELAMIVGVAATPSAVTMVRLGNANLMGEAVAVAASWQQGDFYRDHVNARITDYQFLGRPYQLGVEIDRREIGDAWFGEFSHPYFTDLQRIAWRASAGESEDLLPFRRLGGEGGAIQTVRRYSDVGGLLRIGMPGRLSLFGASFSTATEQPRAAPVLVTDSGVVAPDSVVLATLTGRYQSHHNARINALWGVRNIDFVRVRGFDALNAPQDIRVGFQFGTLFGRSLPMAGADDDDIFVSADLYMARGGRRGMVALQARGEGREDGDTQRWDGVITSGRGAWYFKPVPSQTLIVSGEWSVGWRARVPYQVSFSDAEGGLRGYSASRLAGAQRAVLRAEHRASFGTYKQLAELGGAVFVDGGRLWAGDAPFGIDATPHFGAGLGLLAALPPRSKRLWRVDVAFPLTADPDAKWEVRLSSRDRTRSFFRDPDDVRRARERSVPAGVFNWP